MSALSSLVLIVVAGCVPPAQQSGYAGQQPQPAAQQPAAQTTSGCMQVFNCFRGCTEQSCVQNCLAQADPESQAAANAVMQCSSQKCSNSGEDCMGSQCGAEVETCSSAGTAVAAADPGQPAQPAGGEVMRPGQPHSTANILPWMVGDWIGTNHQFQFFEDGRVRRSTATPMYTDKGTYGCVSLINELGNVRQEGDLLIMTFEPADQNHCGEKDKGPALTIRYRITWEQYSDGPVMLQLNDIDCTAGAMWCNDRMRRR